MSRVDFNAQTIAEFRKNHGKVGGHFEGAPLLLLHTVGKKTGKPRVNPMMYLKDGERYLVFASKGGAPTNPDWYHNLKANPDVEAEIGDEKLKMRAQVLVGAEHDRIYKKQSSLYPQFGEYQKKTSRTIPVISLTRKK